MTIQIGNKYNGIPMGKATSGGNGEGSITPQLVQELPERGQEGVIYRVPVTDTSVDPPVLKGYREYYWIEAEQRYEDMGYVPITEEWVMQQITAAINTVTAQFQSAIQATNANVSALSSSLSSVTTDLQAAETNITELQTDVSELQTAVETNTTDIETLENQLNGLSFQKITLSDAQDLQEAEAFEEDKVYYITDQDTVTIDGGVIEESEEEPEETVS